MGGQIMAQSRMAKGPDGTNGFAAGWTRRTSLYTAAAATAAEENFSKFHAALQSTGVAAELGAGPYTIFAPTDPALESYELLRGPVTADIVKMHIVPGNIASADVPTAAL